MHTRPIAHQGGQRPCGQADSPQALAAAGAALTVTWRAHRQGRRLRTGLLLWTFCVGQDVGHIKAAIAADAQGAGEVSTPAAEIAGTGAEPRRRAACRGTSTVPPPTCADPVPWEGQTVQAAGESLRYQVSVDGLSVGAVDFQVARVGQYGGQSVVEFRSVFKLDHLLASMAEMTGQAAAVVALPDGLPVTAMIRYGAGDSSWEETLSFRAGGCMVNTRQQAGSVTPESGGQKAQDKRFTRPYVDFLTAFYRLRQLPARGTTRIAVYGNGKGHSVLLTPHGQGRIKTPVGMRDAAIYEARYGPADTASYARGEVWLSQTEERVPYRIALQLGTRHVEAQLHTYRMGQPPKVPRPKPLCSDASD